MLGSHLPISRLSYGFEPLYDAYDELLANLSPADQDSLFGATATSWFGFDRLALPVRDGDASRDRTPRETALPDPEGFDLSRQAFSGANPSSRLRKLACNHCVCITPLRCSAPDGPPARSLWQ